MTLLFAHRSARATGSTLMTSQYLRSPVWEKRHLCRATLTASHNEPFRTTWTSTLTNARWWLYALWNPCLTFQRLSSTTFPWTPCPPIKYLVWPLCKVPLHSKGPEACRSPPCSFCPWVLLCRLGDVSSTLPDRPIGSNPEEGLAHSISNTQLPTGP